MTKLPKCDIDLDKEERELLSGLVLDLRDRPHNPAFTVANGERAAQLMGRLLERNAIPSHRLNWFRRSDHYVGGGGKSREDQWRSNLLSNDEIFRHPNFLSVIAYFMGGPDLPAGVIREFAREAEKCGMITSGDVSRLSAVAGQLARSYRLEQKYASEEFFKLGLEHGMSASYSTFLREKVRSMRY